MCCHPCFYFPTTLLSSANSSKGWCRSGWKARYNSVSSAKCFRQTLCFSLWFCQVECCKGGREWGLTQSLNELHTSQLCLKKTTGLPWHAGLCKSGMNKTTEEQYWKCLPRHKVASQEFHGQWCRMQHWGPGEREARSHQHLHCTSYH